MAQPCEDHLRLGRFWHEYPGHELHLRDTSCITESNGAQQETSDSYFRAISRWKCSPINQAQFETNKQPPSFHIAPGQTSAAALDNRRRAPFETAEESLEAGWQRAIPGTETVG